MCLNSEWAMDRPSRRCRIDLLNLFDIAQKVWEIPEIFVELENAFNKASNHYARFKRIFVQRWRSRLPHTSHRIDRSIGGCQQPSRWRLRDLFGQSLKFYCWSKPRNQLPVQ